MLKILGDLCFSDGYFDMGVGIGTSIKTGRDPFEYLNRDKNDFWIGNFECVCADSPDSNFIITPHVLDNVKHLDLYGVANNHSMQIGETGYCQTLDYLKERGIKYAGSDNQRSTIFNHQNKKIGLLAFSMRPDNFSSQPLYWHLPEIYDITKEIDKLDKCDFKIAFIHWGYEFINRPNIEQRQLAHCLVDTGIDLVVGMHPHVAQGAEIYKGKSIFYSLGNALFNMPWSPTKYGLMVNVDLVEEEAKIWTDYIFIGDDYFPRVVDRVPELYSKEYLDKQVLITEENEKYFKSASKFNNNYTKANRRAILRRLLSMPWNEKIKLIQDFTNRRILKK